MAVPCVGKVVSPKPELSAVAGSDEPPLDAPLANEAAVPPVAAIVPAPSEGLMVPVPVLLSGVGELKFHWVMLVCANSDTPLIQLTAASTTDLVKILFMVTKLIIRKYASTVLHQYVLRIMLL
ncbi:hypothetical protein D3C72_851770 [compost metagenome]